MDLLQYRPSPVTAVLTWIALGALAIGVILAEVVVVTTAQSMAQLYPEFAHLEAPLVAAALVFGFCVEAVLLITALLVSSIDRGRIFDRSALRLVNALAISLILATLTIVVVIPLLPGPPALVLAALGGIIAGAAVTLVVLVLRSLLRQAAFMRLELDEVV
ncbi:DUF2975 domain-containing protein [Glaciihabitans arcticus]|uniref:DUF2975 domain-containing protein n=1 Tax=Glaciihabitans arcticus TaxID=2668039 RepID=A0A4V2JER4_9MICO|nr:DUF2975 domain-containing protein [Glaciihabitans arcticus]TBN56589.1 DUF2975 domain-containing protein [Glaciihabitans arcticus]